MRGYKDFNFPAFDEAKRYLHVQGYSVISPADLDRACGVPKDGIPGYVRRDTEALCNVDSIYMLRGWQQSVGARAEYCIAQWLGLSILYQPEMVGE